MATKKFKFNYDFHEAEVTILVNTDLFTREHAKATLEFFSWNYDEYNDPIEEVLKKYAMEAIKVATRYSFNVSGVISDFDDKEGFAKLDGSLGLTLTSIDAYEFDEDKLKYKIEEV